MRLAFNRPGATERQCAEIKRELRALKAQGRTSELDACSRAYVAIDILAAGGLLTEREIWNARSRLLRCARHAQSEPRKEKRDV